MQGLIKQVMLLLTVLLFAMTVLAQAQQESDGTLYEWKDSKGVVNVTNNLSNVPPEYRAKAKRIAPGDGGTPDGNVVEGTQMPALPPAAAGTTGGDDAALKAQWQSRMLDAKRKLQSAEDNYQQLAKRKSDLQAQWGSSGSALPPQSVLDQMQQLDSDMASAQREIDNARNMINTVIPDEARRAGVPPGWLREVE